MLYNSCDLPGDEGDLNGGSRCDGDGYRSVNSDADDDDGDGDNDSDEWR